MIIRELNDIEEMLKHLDVLNELYPNLTIEAYKSDLQEMIPHNYGQVAVFDNEECVGLCGYWVGKKLWCSKYLELDNIVVSSKHRSKGVGKLMFSYLRAKAKEMECTMMALDSYTTNYKAHKMFYNEGFAPKGFHFINIIDEKGVRG
ncbi:MAG: GNAT family N-acetyltransferase [Bacteroidetes bacterium]|nr:GNAT family N-acetyltransferase [Bacteroidota bacterium]